MAHVAIMIRIIPSENRNMYFRMIQNKKPNRQGPLVMMQHQKKSPELP